MILPRAALILAGLIFLALGVAFLLAPAAMMASVDVALTTPLASGDVRAVYGGMQVASGVLLLLAARRADWVRPGLLAAAVLFAGLFAGRVLGLLLDGPPSPFGWLLAVAELGGLLLAVAISRR